MKHYPESLILVWYAPDAAVGSGAPPPLDTCRSEREALARVDSWRDFLMPLVDDAARAEAELGGWVVVADTPGARAPWEALTAGKRVKFEFVHAVAATRRAIPAAGQVRALLLTFERSAATQDVRVNLLARSMDPRRVWLPGATVDRACDAIARERPMVLELLAHGSAGFLQDDLPWGPKQISKLVHSPAGRGIRVLQLLACTGDPLAGESLARAAVAAGVPRVVAFSGPVGDVGAGVLADKVIDRINDTDEVLAPEWSVRYARAGLTSRHPLAASLARVVLRADLAQPLGLAAPPLSASRDLSPRETSAEALVELRAHIGRCVRCTWEVELDLASDAAEAARTGRKFTAGDVELVNLASLRRARACVFGLPPLTEDIMGCLQLGQARFPSPGPGVARVGDRVDVYGMPDALRHDISIVFTGAGISRTYSLSDDRCVLDVPPGIYAVEATLPFPPDRWTWSTTVEASTPDLERSVDQAKADCDIEQLAAWARRGRCAPLLAVGLMDTRQYGALVGACLRSQASFPCDQHLRFELLRSAAAIEGQHEPRGTWWP